MSVFCEVKKCHKCILFYAVSAMTFVGVIACAIIWFVVNNTQSIKIKDTEIQFSKGVEKLEASFKKLDGVVSSVIVLAETVENKLNIQAESLSAIEQTVRDIEPIKSKVFLDQIEEKVASLKNDYDASLSKAVEAVKKDVALINQDREKTLKLLEVYNRKVSKLPRYVIGGGESRDLFKDRAVLLIEKKGEAEAGYYPANDFSPDEFEVGESADAASEKKE